MTSENFVHLHVHTEYSMLDGAARVPDLMQEVARQGMPAIAMTDHGNVFGAYEFYKQAKKLALNQSLELKPTLPLNLALIKRECSGQVVVKMMFPVAVLIRT